MFEGTFADLYEGISQKIPFRACQVQGARVVTWKEFDQRSNALAHDLIAAGLGSQSKVGAFLFNCPEYLETYVAAFKGDFVPFNTNYRYGPQELRYLFDNADAEAIIFHDSFLAVVEVVRHELPLVKRWYCVRSDDSSEIPDWAVDYERLVKFGSHAPVIPNWGRSNEGLLLLYTGGTTGMPKGVMWRQMEMLQVLAQGGSSVLGVEPPNSVNELISRVTPNVEPTSILVASPLMHGTGQLSGLLTMNQGGTVVTLSSRSFDPVELLDAVESSRSQTMIIVGQAFATPLLELLEAEPNRWDLSNLKTILSSGVMWNIESKRRLLRHAKNATMLDSLGSSEAPGMGSSSTTHDSNTDTAQFTLGPTCVVFTEDGKRVVPGSGEKGLIAVGGPLPIGYYKDPEKSVATFKIFEGQRWSVPGDWAEVKADGGLVLLGRGSNCINTGGEKVFPEEVEEVVKLIPEILDAVVVGIPHERFHEEICVIVEVEPTAEINLDLIQNHVRQHLAAYKTPRKFLRVDSMERGPNGKVDYTYLKAKALEKFA